MTHTFWPLGTRYAESTRKPDRDLAGPGQIRVRSGAAEELSCGEMGSVRPTGKILHRGHRGDLRPGGPARGVHHDVDALADQGVESPPKAGWCVRAGR